MTQETTTETPAVAERKLRPRAVELLRKVQEAIREDNHAYNQSEPGWPDFRKPHCDSPACIIGWLEHFYGNEALDSLLTWAQYSRLFYADEWPAKFFNRAEGHGWDRIPADTAIARIDHFIATDGEE